MTDRPGGRTTSIQGVVLPDPDLLDAGLAGERVDIAAYQAALDSGLLDEGTAAVAMYKDRSSR